MKTQEQLKQALQQIDRKSYPAYKSLQGGYEFHNYHFFIERVQGDPFASPSKVSIEVDGKRAGFLKEWRDASYKKTALEDLILRRFGKELKKVSFQGKGSGKSGMMSVSACGQEVLERSAVTIEADGRVLLRMEMGFPANGRTVNARELEKMIFLFLPKVINQALFAGAYDRKEIQKVVDLSVDQAYIRQELKRRKLVAFLADGSLLPRESGISQRPLKEGKLFQSPKSQQVTMDLPNRGTITGMGIPEGITLIVGGGYHGKSTLLEAIERGVYNHISGDGREYVITDDSAMKIRAEDGRSIQKVDISMFIQNLPNGKDTVSFFTENASGSTSQAASVIEAMEAGSRVLLMDEDTSATNFMIRDELMQRVVAREQEPIIPFLDRVTELKEVFNVSTILVAGSSGSYFHKADTILQMEEYMPKDITAFAKEEAAKFTNVSQPVEQFQPGKEKRCPKKNAKIFDNERMKIKTGGRDTLLINREAIDLRYVEQLVDEEQVRALGQCLLYGEKRLFNGERTMAEAVAEIDRLLWEKGFPALYGKREIPGNLARPRKQEIFACFNRFRGLMK